MSLTLTAKDRSSLLRLASSLPKGDAFRRSILSGLSKVSSDEINVTGSGRDEWAEKVFEMVKITYSSIGVPAKNPRELMEFDLWVLNLGPEGTPIAFTLFKTTPYGLKAGLSGFDGSSLGKSTNVNNIRKKFTKQGVYGEVSHAVEGIATKAGAPAVCTAYVEGILKKKIEPLEDGIHYVRNITGVGPTKKVMVGYPKGIPVTDYFSPSCATVASKLASLPKEGCSEFFDRCAHLSCVIHED